VTHARGSWLVGVIALLAAACGDGAGGTGGGGSGGTGGTGGPGGISGGNGTPVILSFSASPASLPAAGQATLRWQVTGASSLSIDQGVGAVTGESTAVNVTATTIYTLTATNAMGASQATTAVVVGQNPSQRNTRRVVLLSPTAGESFIAPTSLRLQAWGYDPNVDTNQPSPGLGSNASKVQFFVDDEVVLEVAGGSAEYSVFKGYAAGIAAGQHRVWARAIYVNPADVLDTLPALISVDPAPTYGRTVELDADVTLSGSMPYELVGTAGSRVRLNGNGHRITGTTSGPVTLKFVDAFNVGSNTDRTQSGFNITTTGTLTIEDSTFDGGNTMRFSIGGSATASIRRSLWRSNMRNPLGQLPESAASDPGSSYPVLIIEGTSTGAKVFAGNNIGAGWVDFNNVRAWVVGGDTDADSNILIGPRVGIHPQGELQVRRNYSHHAYRGGWSQGNNFEIDGANVVVESNVIYGSSWPVRGVGGEFRYNLVVEAGHQWLWATKNNASVHHNIFLGGEADIGGIYVLYNPTGVRIFNNTIDGLGKIGQAVLISEGMVSLTSNLFTNVPSGVVQIASAATLTADYNLFSGAQMGYSDGRRPSNDVTNTDPMLSEPQTELFNIDEVGIWRRTISVRDVLSTYRARYTPRTGSPAIDAGDPAGGSGNDIGAVGAGAANAMDKFGVLP
jgi:hypothetical protein